MEKICPLLYIGRTGSLRSVGAYMDNEKMRKQVICIKAKCEMFNDKRDHCGLIRME